MSELWRVGKHYGIHVYCGDVPVATFFTASDAKRAVEAVNATVSKPAEPFSDVPGSEERFNRQGSPALREAGGEGYRRSSDPEAMSVIADG